MGGWRGLQLLISTGQLVRHAALLSADVAALGHPLPTLIPSGSRLCLVYNRFSSTVSLQELFTVFPLRVSAAPENLPAACFVLLAFGAALPVCSQPELNQHTCECRGKCCPAATSDTLNNEGNCQAAIKIRQQTLRPPSAPRPVFSFYSFCQHSETRAAWPCLPEVWAAWEGRGRSLSRLKVLLYPPSPHPPPSPQSWPSFVGFRSTVPNVSKFEPLRILE